MFAGFHNFLHGQVANIFSQKPNVEKRTVNDIQRRLAEVEKRDKKTVESFKLAAEEARKELAAAKAREEVAVAKAKESAMLAAEDARKQLDASKAREEIAVAKAKEANEALKQGIRPLVMPTRAQFEAVKVMVEYNPEKLHFAVCGSSGSGKSTLINAFRGLKTREEGAADVGVAETTAKVTRYPDPREEIPFSRFVWYDIPGAGTTAVPDWQYFNDQGLFVFDFIVMVYDVRFTKIDVAIVENCYRFNIPVFIVRSKADQHIDNMLKEQELEEFKPGDQEYEDVKADYINATKSDFDKHIRIMAESRELDARDRQMVLNQRVYIVNSTVVRSLNSLKEVKKSRIIDEVLLAEDMLSASARRRYPKLEKGLIQNGKEVLTAGFLTLRL